MPSNVKRASQKLTDPAAIVRQNRRSLLKVFWAGVTALFLVELFTVQDLAPATIGGALLISVAALYPSYLWCSGKALGMPIFPIFALTYLWTHAFPLLSAHPQVITYSPDSHLFAGVTVSVFLGLGTLTWLRFVNSVAAPPRYYRALAGNTGDTFFLFILAFAALYNMSFVGGWLNIDAGIFALIRGTILGLSVLAVFVLSYRLGAGYLSKNQQHIFVLFSFTLAISSAAGLILRASISTLTVATIAFVLGRKKMPILPVCIAIIILSLLHYGKAEMRAKYWFGPQAGFVQPWQYPAWYAEWLGHSFEYLSQGEPQEAKQDPSERSSVIQMLLLAESKTPKYLPYLYGKTYLILPQLVVPRFLNSNKIRSHEGTYILSIYYGIQTREATFKTTIAWGLLAEVYANFGILGCAGLGIILGAGYGQATRWCMTTPLLSARCLFGVLLMSFAAQSEWTAGVYVAALFQSGVTLVGISFVFMKIPSLK